MLLAGSDPTSLLWPTVGALLLMGLLALVLSLRLRGFGPQPHALDLAILASAVAIAALEWFLIMAVVEEMI